MHYDRREFLTALTASAATAWFADCPGALAASASLLHPLVQALRDPPRASRPQIRWWWPGGAVLPKSISEEAAIIAQAGFGGFEIADVRDSVTEAIDPRTQGWGSPAWIAAIEAALEGAVARGVMPSLTLGPHWPTGIPGVRPDDDAASKELVYGLTTVFGGQTFRGLVPPPVQKRPSGVLPIQNEHPPVTPLLLAVQALRVIDRSTPVPVFDPASLIDLTESVQTGRLEWKAPSEGEWGIFSFWMRGTGQIQNMFNMNKTASMLADPVPYVLDIYGSAAVAALTGYWESHLLPERIRQLMRKTGGAFFEDSLELSAACPWTVDARAEFARRRNYRLEPYFALLVSRQPTMSEMILGGGRPQLFALKGIDAKRVRHDFDSVLSEMYVDNRLKGLTAWASRLGMRFRVQAIGSEINAGYAAAFADIPEGDNSNDIHGWRAMAAGRDIGRRSILSDEAGTFVQGSAHVACWRDLLYMLQRDMAGGVNQVVLHGFSHATAPGARWPGFSAFGRAIGNDWGPRDPMWKMAPAVTACIGRLQHLLRQGRSQVDLAVIGIPLRSQSLLHAGYTFQYPAVELFNLPQMRFASGRLVPDGPAYRALVLNAVPAVDSSVAEKLLALGRSGLPVVVVGDTPAQARGWREAVLADGKVRDAMATLLALPTTRRVSRQGDVPKALAELGIDSLVRFSANDRVLLLRRTATDVDILYLLNDQDNATDQTIDIRLPGIPYRVDLWTGEIHEVYGWRHTGNHLHVPLSLAGNEATAFIIAQRPLPGARKDPSSPEAAAPIELGPWEVELEDWHPGSTPDSTRRERQSMRLEKLVPWSSLPGCEGMSGSATYTTQLNLMGENPRTGAELTIEQLGGSAMVSVNDSAELAVNPFTLKTRIGSRLKPGMNRIKITVVSPLNNRLLADGIEDQGFKPPVNDAQSQPPPSPPVPVPPLDPDLVDGPRGMVGMQPGAAPPGMPRTIRQYGLIGSVRII